MYSTNRFPVNLSCLVISVVSLCCTLLAAETISPPDLWSNYDPNKGDFKEEIIASIETRLRSDQGALCRLQLAGGLKAN